MCNKNVKYSDDLIKKQQIVKVNFQQMHSLKVNKKINFLI